MVQVSKGCLNEVNIISLQEVIKYHEYGGGQSTGITDKSKIIKKPIVPKRLCVIENDF